MFTIGLLLMGASVLGLIALAYMQARYPDALEAILMPIDTEKPADNPLADGLTQPEVQSMEGAAKPATSEAEEVENIDIDEIPVNSVSRSNVPPVPPSE